jgi:hypothetical protein
MAHRGCLPSHVVSLQAARIRAWCVHAPHKAGCDAPAMRYPRDPIRSHGGDQHHAVDACPYEVLTSMLIDPATRQTGSWEVDPPRDRTMLALQYLVAFIAAAAALLLSSLH